MKRSPKRDVAQDITNLIIRKIEEGTLPWRRPWKKTGAGGAPLRANGVPYTGINRLYLWAVADAMGYQSRYWMTYRQAQELGGQVRRGESAEPSIYFNTTKKTEVDRSTGEESSRTIRFMRAYSVFNASQIDGLPVHFYPDPVPETPPTPSQKAAAIKAFFAPIPSEVRYGGDRAFYSPGGDFIQMPHRHSFVNEDGLAATLAHEVGNIASVLVAGGAGEGAVERYLRHLHCGEQSPGGGRLDARTAAGAATQRCGVIGIAAGASGIRRRLPASRSSAVLAR